MLGICKHKFLQPTLLILHLGRTSHIYACKSSFEVCLLESRHDCLRPGQHCSIYQRPYRWQGKGRRTAVNLMYVHSAFNVECASESDGNMSLGIAGPGQLRLQRVQPSLGDSLGSNNATLSHHDVQQ